MKVMIIADSDPRKEVIGGIGIYSLNLLRYLESKNIPVIFVGKKSQGRIISKYKNTKFIELCKSNQSNHFFLLNLYKLANKIKINKDVIIHSQRPDWIVPFNKFKNKKIISLHGSHSKNVYLKKGHIQGVLYDKLEKKAFRIANVILAVSHDNINYYSKKYKVHAHKIKYIPVAIEYDKFQNNKSTSKKFKIDNSKKIVLYIGRLEKEKNLSLLIQACSKLDVNLVITGTGREEVLLRKYGDKMNPGKSNVIFLGSVAHNEIPVLIASADVFALTSHYEGLPTVILESLATGIPVIATDVGDVSTIVNNSVGSLVTKKNIENKLKSVLKKSKSYKKSCKQMAKKYDWKNIGKKILEVYDEL